MDLKELIKSTYEENGFSVEFLDPDRSDSDSDINTDIFVPYEKEYKCANKDCHNIWFELITEETHTLCCGGRAKVCFTCKCWGFSVYDGKGDGRFYLSRYGEEIDNYDYKTAYNLTDEDVKAVF